MTGRRPVLQACSGRMHWIALLVGHGWARRPDWLFWGRVFSAVWVITALGCGGGELPHPEIPPIDEESMGGTAATGDGGEVDAPSAAAFEGGPRVRMAYRSVAQGARLTLAGAACEEAMVFVDNGNLRTPADEDLSAGTLYRTHRQVELVATEATTALLILTQPPAGEDSGAASDGAGSTPDSASDNSESDNSESDNSESVGAAGGASPDARSAGELGRRTDNATRCPARAGGDVVADAESVEVWTANEGTLRVKILLDQEGGASFGSFSILEGAPGLGVPVHTHPGVAEALFIASGNGTMIREEERFAVAPGRIIYVPPDVQHGYEAGTEPLRVYQVYGPPGPEQRFRVAPTSP